MNILTRQDAIAQRLSRYFTGLPCKHGHISQRYTKTLNCIECLHPTFEAQDIKQRREARAALKPTRLDLSGMKLIKIRLHKNDLDLFESMAMAAAMMHEAAIKLRNIRSRLVPKVIGIDLHIYGFMCFPDDEAMLREFQDSLETARRPAASISTSQQRLAAVLAEANAEADRNWPEEHPYR